MKNKTLLVVLVLAFFATSVLVNAQDMIGTEITSITTVSMQGEMSMVEGAAGNSGFDGSTFAITFLGLNEMVTGFQAGDITVSVEGAIPATVTARRNPDTDTREVAWYQGSVNTGNSTITIATTGPHTQAELLNTNSVILGADNIFVNEGAAANEIPFQGNQSIERIDFVLESSVMAGKNTGFVVMEKGPFDAHDAFGIAAITGVDEAGNPTAFGEIFMIPAGWGQTILAQYPPYIVLSNGEDGSGGTPTSLTLLASAQAAGGLLFRTSELAAAGTEIFGYALIGPDVTCTPEELVDVTAACYPTTTANDGGLDLVGVNLGALTLE